MLYIVTSLISTILIMCLAFAEFDGRDALHCNRTRFDYAVHNDCVPVYKEHMAASNYTNECPWPHIQPYYHRLDNCVERVVNITSCTEASLKNELFLELHKTYFFHCHFLKDPDGPVLLLFMLPCVIITILIPFFYSYFTSLEFMHP